MNKKITIDFQDPKIPFTWSDEPEQKKELPVNEEDTRIFYISFGSGSSGNAAYIGTKKAGLIIDAGIRHDAIQASLQAAGIPMSRVKGLLLTHDHSDHVRYAYSLLRNNKHIRLFCTNRVLNGLLRRHNISKRIKEYHYPIFKEIPFHINEFEITAFDVPHDGSDNMGFSIQYDDRRFVAATDLGEVAGRALHYIKEANYLMIEANYDAKMLRNGPYPEYLKARIATDHGHMDNEDTAKLLTEILNPALKYVFLCHLSHDNNTPEKALETIKGALEAKGIKVGDASQSIEDRKADIHLMALPRFEPSPLFAFRKQELT